MTFQTNFESYLMLSKFDTTNNIKDVYLKEKIDIYFPLHKDVRIVKVDW